MVKSYTIPETIECAKSLMNVVQTTFVLNISGNITTNKSLLEAAGISLSVSHLPLDPFGCLMAELSSSGVTKMTCKQLDQSRTMATLNIQSGKLDLSIGMNGQLPVQAIKNAEIEMEIKNNIVPTSSGLQPRTKGHGVTVPLAMDGMRTCA